MGKNDQHHLRNRISSQLVKILRLYVILITSLVMGVACFTTYYFHRNELEHERALVLTKVGADLASIGHELKSLATAPVLWTGLTDSFGRENYLAPLLARFNRDEQRQFLVLDYRGRVFLAPGDAQQAQALAGLPGVQRAVAEGRNGFGVRALEGGNPELLLVQKVMSPVSPSPVGFILARIDVPALTVPLKLAPEVRLAFGLGDQPLMPAPGEGLMMSTQATTPINAGDIPVPITVWVGHPMQQAVIAGLGVVLAALVLGLLTIRRVVSWARHFSSSTTQRLDRLLVDCQRLLAGDTPSSVDRGPEDELSEVTEALAIMLRQQKQFTDELRKTSLVFSTAAEGILVTDTNGVIVDVNPALGAMTGYSREELLGRQAGTLYRSVGRDDTSREMAQALRTEGRWSGETSFLARSGRVIPTSVSISRINDEGGGSLGNVAVITDVTRIKEAEAKLRDMAYRDALTGLPNFRRMSEEVRLLLRPGSGPRMRQGFAVLFIDMDQLKFINDNYGHETGDVVIKAVAAHLRAALPRGHLLCRRSGDEFIAVVDMPDARARDNLQRLLERLTPIDVPVASGMLPVTATVGVSRYPEDGDDWQSLQICADVAMNEAKQTRRGSVGWFDAELGRKVYRHRLIQSKLAQAIEERAIQVHYQPEVDLRTGRVIGFEALARWTDPELGVIRPTEFIAVAEESHLIDPLSMLVVQTVLQDKQALQARFPGAKVALNVAPHVFLGSRLLKFLSAQSEQASRILDGLEIELTESQIANSEATLLAQLQALTDLGVKLVIDDFGTGYSSLSRLTQFPISRLKIDRSFVAGLEFARQGKIARLIVNLAKVLGFEVTAEGVETPDQRADLLKMGCLRAQGWLFAKAMPVHDAVALPDTLDELTVVVEV